MALGIAASQPVGVREQFGTMTKALHPGAAARAGLMAALLAKHGYTASPRALEAPRGLMQTYSTKCDWREIDGRARHALRDRVQHVQAVRVRRRHSPGDRRLRAASRRASARRGGHRAHRSPRASARARAHREDGAAHRARGQVQRLPRLRRRNRIRPGGRSRVRDRAREPRPTLSRCAAAIHATIDDAIGEAAADVTIRCTDGRTLHLFVAHAVGSLERPMSDADLARKFHGLVDPVLGAEGAARLAAQCARIGQAPDLRPLFAAARPGSAS